MFRHRINYLKIVIITSMLGLFLLHSCNKKTNDSLELKNNKSFEDTVITATPKNDKIPKVKIDSVKMHAFDNLYFGIQNEIVASEFSVNDMIYTIKSSESEPNKGLSYFILENKSKITTLQKAKRVLDDLKNTIAKKYKNGITLNKTYYIKHPEEMEKNENFFDPRAMYKYDKKIIGLPYEFAACKWNLKYKEIQIGYFIDHKNKTVVFQSSPKDDYYIIYIEIRSKVIKPEKTNSADKENDSNKF